MINIFCGPGSLTDLEGVWAWGAGPHLLDTVLVSQVATAGMKNRDVIPNRHPRLHPHVYGPHIMPSRTNPLRVLRGEQPIVNQALNNEQRR